MILYRLLMPVWWTIPWFLGVLNRSKEGKPREGSVYDASNIPWSGRSFCFKGWVSVRVLAGPGGCLRRAPGTLPRQPGSQPPRAGLMATPVYWRRRGEGRVWSYISGRSWGLGGLTPSQFCFSLSVSRFLQTCLIEDPPPPLKNSWICPCIRIIQRPLSQYRG